MLLIVHIALSCIASGVAVTGAAKLYKSRSSLSSRHFASLWMTVMLSATSGIGLLFTGVSVARVCVEASVLVGAAFAVSAYSRKHQLAREEM